MSVVKAAPAHVIGYRGSCREYVGQPLVVIPAHSTIASASTVDRTPDFSVAVRKWLMTAVKGQAAEENPGTGG